MRRDANGLWLPARDERRNLSLSFNPKIATRTVSQLQPRSKVITKRFRNSVPKKAPRSVRMLPPESPGSLSGLSGLQWIFRGRQAKKLPPFRLDSNISERWQNKDDVGKLPSQQQEG